MDSLAHPSSSIPEGRAAYFLLQLSWEFPDYCEQFQEAANDIRGEGLDRDEIEHLREVVESLDDTDSEWVKTLRAQALENLEACM